MNTNNVPNSFQFPNWLVDHVMYMLTAEENVLVTFTVRHIFGWEQERIARKRPISITMFERGYTDKSGNRYAGTGLSRNTIIKGMRSLVDFGIFIEVQGNDADGTIWEIPAKSDVKWQALHDRHVAKQQAAKDKAIKSSETRMNGGSSHERGFIPSTSDSSSDELNQTHSNPDTNTLSDFANAQSDMPHANANEQEQNNVSTLNAQKSAASAKEKRGSGTPAKSRKSAKDLTTKDLEILQFVYLNTREVAWLMNLQDKFECSEVDFLLYMDYLAVDYSQSPIELYQLTDNGLKALGKSKPKAQRPRDGLFDALSEYFNGANGGLVARAKKELVGSFPDVKGDEVLAFRAWWQDTRKDKQGHALGLPGWDKLPGHFGEWLKAGKPGYVVEQSSPVANAECEVCGGRGYVKQGNYMVDCECKS